MKLRNLLFLGVLAVLAVVAYNSLYVITEIERAVLLEFGRVKQADVSPGLHVKFPVINEVRRFDGRVLTLDASPERFLTLEKKAVIVDSFAKFRIDDVSSYYVATSGDERRARNLLAQRINTGLRNQISRRTMHEVVSGQRDLLMQELTEELDGVAREELGLELVDVRVKRIDLPDEVSQSVYNRMITEREIEAREHRAKGQELAAGIRADADRQRTVILAEAYREAEEVRGAGDAQAAHVYAAAYNKNAEFYRFYRSLNAYRATFSDKQDVLLIEPDSDFFRYLNELKVAK